MQACERRAHIHDRNVNKLRWASTSRDTYRVEDWLRTCWWRRSRSLVNKTKTFLRHKPYTVTDSNNSAVGHKHKILHNLTMTDWRLKKKKLIYISTVCIAVCALLLHKRTIQSCLNYCNIRCYDYRTELHFNKLLCSRASCYCHNVIIAIVSLI